MVRENYTTEQVEALGAVMSWVNQLREYEKLDERRHAPILGLRDSIDSAIADTVLDSFPSYGFMEDKLKDALARAEGVGLGGDDFVKKVRKVVGK